MVSEDAEQQDEPQQHVEQSSGKKQPGTWSPFETVHLIDAYQEKWYELKRGQLRTRHWEEVAASLASRCANNPESTPKSSVQCRHKIEKLRRRYRAECQVFLRKGHHGPVPGAVASSSWPFFERMDRMERGPAAIAEAAALRMALPISDPEFHKRHREFYHEHDDAMSLDEDAEDSDQPPPRVFSTRKRRHQHHVSQQEDEDDPPYGFTPNRKHARLDGSSSFGSKRDGFRNPKSYDSPDLGGPRLAAELGGPYGELVSVIRTLGEGFLRMEQMKIQMLRETERFRADMEVRRTEMVLESQKEIAELFSKALGTKKKSKKPPQSPED